MIKKFQTYTTNELRDGGITIGSNVQISSDVVFHNPTNITIGNDVRIDTQCVLISGVFSKIIIGNNVHISSGCYFYGNDGNITLEDFTGTSARVIIYTACDDFVDGYRTNATVCDRWKKIKRGDVILRKYSIVGSLSIIFPDVVLDVATSVGCHSMVKKSTNPFDIVAGVPATFIKKRSNIWLN